ncbi:PREDICTED: uncharacterized protein LOC109180688 isoform X2 [Ipomoea nil]|uniref:uncharacterized protein LOC109180688 isoform X2 n=1 Tax=Ipomoea nil TaxID=35883 RepID=UPI000900C179|nr:PREDICTED: uncharacterized protein LOC109180688 isoform X2 [Ipomoea nil]
MAYSNFTLTTYPAITMHKLKGNENYSDWAASVKLWFKGQGMSDHLTKNLSEITENVKEWEKADALLCNLLWQSIDPKLYNIYIYTAYETCKAVWDKAKSLYTNDVQQLYSMVSNIVGLQQQHMEMSEFLGQIEALKETFNTLLPVNTIVEEQLQHRDKFFMVLTLAALRPDLSHVRDQILSSPIVPSLSETFARLLRVSPTPGETNMKITGESSSLVSQSTHKDSVNIDRGGASRKNHPRCDYCHKVGHIKDRCYKLHGRPPQFAHVAQATTSDFQITMSPTDYEDYLKFKVSKQATPVAPPGPQHGGDDWRRA